jgi:hypothetical protein
MNNEYPKVMMVSDKPITKDNLGEKRVVWAYNPKFNYPYFTYPSYIKTLKDVEDIPVGEGWWAGSAVWKYAQEPQQQIELTLDEIADKFGIPVEQLKIKK